jgi:hypothetical protein
MRRLFLISLLLWLLIPLQQAAMADNVVVFSETFDKNTSTKGGRDGDFNNGSGTKFTFDETGWTGDNSTKIYAASQCIRFGTGDANGVLTTRTITLEGTTVAKLTFSAAGWGDKGNVTNTLTVSVSSGDLSGDKEITLENKIWNDYTVYVIGASSFQLTFTGKRGFLDDVKVTSITEVADPTVTESCTFWPNTTEAASKVITVTPSLGTAIRYTTDGSTPTTNHGTEATLATNFSIHATTTVKAIAYVGNVTSQVVTKTYTLGNITVNSIFEFKQLDDDTEARLFLSADAEARVLHAHDGKLLFLRDNTGTLCLDFGTTATFNPTPEHNQHVAGWIVGRKATDKGLTKLMATANTNTNYLALAAPVTEADTEPTVVTPYGGGQFDFSNYAGDWVTFSEAYVSPELAVENVFGTENVADEFMYDQLVDVSAIVVSSEGGKATMAPVAYNGITPVVYVLNEDKNYGGPATDISHATVRLKRTLSKDYWNTLVVPFEYSSFEGEIRAYSDYIDGNTMHFSKTDQIEAGQPYLVKPNEDIVDPVFSDIKLSATLAASINKGGDYEFVGSYSPVELNTDKSMLFLTRQGQLAYPSSEETRLMKGSRAYFYVPNGGNAPTLSVDNEDGTTSILIPFASSLISRDDKVYDLQGRRVSKPTKGLYIVNGKKLIIH